MADPLSILGGVAAVEQLAEVLLKSVQFVKDLRELPQKLSDVLQDVERSITSLQHVCTVLQPALSVHINPRMSLGLTETLKTLDQCVQDIQTALQPLVGPGQTSKGNFPQRVSTSLKAWNMDKKISDKLQRVHMLNLEVIKHLQIVGLELQVTFNTGAVQAARGIQNDQTRILDTIQTQHRDAATANSVQHDVTRNQLGAKLSDTQTRTVEVQSTVTSISKSLDMVQSHQNDLSASMTSQYDASTTLLAGISSTSQDTQGIVTEIRGTTVNMVDEVAHIKLLLHEQKQMSNNLMAVLTGRTGQLSVKSQQTVSSLGEGDRLMVQQHAQSQLLRYPGDLAAAKRTWTPCRCRPIHHVIDSSHWGVRVTTETSQDHRSDCPHFRRGTRTRVSSIRMVLLPFVNATMELAIGATTGAGGWALAPTLRFRGIVQRSKSPLFRAFAENVFSCCDMKTDDDFGNVTDVPVYSRGGEDETLRLIPEPKPLGLNRISWDIPCLKPNLARLSSRLTEAVERGDACAMDTDERGQTLLFDFVKLLELLEDKRDAVAPELEVLLQTILSLGVDINARSDCINGMKRRPTAIDYFLYRNEPRRLTMWEPRLNPYRHLYYLLDEMARLDLLDHMDLSYTAAYHEETRLDTMEYRMSSSQLKTRSAHLKMVWRRPELGEALGLDEFEMAIVRRSLPDLIRLEPMSQNQPGRKKRRVFDILELALGWDDGLRHLVLKNYGILHAFQRALYLHDTASISILLETPKAIFVNRRIFEKNPFVFRPPDAYWATIIGLVSRQLSKRRLALKELAMLHLAPQDQEQIGLHADTLLETNAKLIFDRLQRITKVPVSLKCWVSPYFAVTTGRKDNVLIPTVLILDTLYEIGFHAVDAPDEEGYSPLFRYMDSSRRQRFSGSVDTLHEELGVVKWFLSKGSRCITKKTPVLNGTWPTVLFYVADRLSNFVPSSLSGRTKDISGNVLRSVQGMSASLSSEAHTTPDTCVCYCSTGGCLPCHRLWLHCQPLHHNRPFIPPGRSRITDRYCLLTFWTSAWHMKHEEEELTYSESARLDMFERLGMAHTCCRLADRSEAKESEGLREGDKQLAGVLQLLDRFSLEERERLRKQREDFAELLVLLERLTAGERERLREENEDPAELLKRLTAEESERLREEDEESAELLESLMAAYRRGRQAHLGSAKSFWRVWRKALDPILPPVSLNDTCPIWARDHAVQTRRAARERKALETAGYAGPPYDGDFLEVIRVHFRDRDWNPILPAENDVDLRNLFTSRAPRGRAPTGKAPNEKGSGGGGSGQR